MKKIKRWLAVLLVFQILNVATALRASQLFLQAKTSTSTSSTTETSIGDDAEEIETTEILNNTSTKPTLTGIPQIDYIWDPNLPRELHGYNLTDYPFFNAVPPDDEIDFRCDGLHDGFYASVKHKCQLYHHCLFGIRYDFLCANFTAFDQKTFICHFVSEVDCKNSPKYYHRNDALYMPATTTTLPPPTTTTTTTTTTLPPPPRRQNNRPRRPLRRKRPQYEDEEDYYDDYDYYEDRSYRRRKQRPRHRRPDYDEEYEDRRSFSDERYDRRPNKNRNDEYEYDTSSDEGRRKLPRNRNRNPTIKSNDNEKKDRQRSNEKRGNRYSGNNRKFSDDDGNDEEVTQPRDRHRYGNNEKRFNQRDRRPSLNNKDDNKPSNKPEPSSDEENDRSEPSILVKPSVSSSSSLSSLFDRPRAAPRIARPVPNNEKSKYAYNAATSSTTTSTTTEKPLTEDDYYDDEDYDHETEHKNVTRDIVPAQANSKPFDIDEQDENVGEEEISDPIDDKQSSTQLKFNENVREEQRDLKHNLRVVKRPFLPSRGGSPYLPRGLQPVGAYQTHEYSTESTPVDMGSTISGVRLLEHGQPILRSQLKEGSFNGPRTTLPPKSSQKLNIEDLYETEYDVTLNDALNPTLKPLSSDLRRRASFPQTREYASQTRNQESSRQSYKYYDY